VGKIRAPSALDSRHDDPHLNTVVAKNIGARALVTRLRRLEGDLQEGAGRALLDAPSRVDSRVPQAVRALIYDLRRACHDTLEVVHLTVEGYAGRRKEGVRRTTTQSRLTTDPHRVLSAAFRIFATTLVSDVELFVSRYSELRITPAVVARFRTHALAAHPNVNMPRDPAKARDWLVGWMKPSASSRVRWTRRLSVVLGVRLEAPAAEVFQTLILARNFLIHPRRRPPRIDWTDPDFPEVMITCVLAIHTFTVRVSDAEV
jgi:hypothetical protein